MRAFKELSERVMYQSRSIIDVDRMVLQEFEKFQQQWPGDYTLSHYYENDTKLVIGVRFKNAQAKTWAEIAWS